MIEGYDYTELAEEWNLYIPKHINNFSTPSDSDWIKMYLKFLISDFGYNKKR